jgi:hypothetical protein
MYWIEVFATEWNARKLEALDALRKATIETKPKP